MKKEILLNNLRLLNIIAGYINDNPRLIDQELMNTNSFSLDEEFYYKILFANLNNIDIEKDKEFFYDYLAKSIHKLDPGDYLNNEYLKNVKIKEKNYKGWRIVYETIEPYEAFIYDDIEEIDDYQYPMVGYFNKKYHYPCIKDEEETWMLITPNEINTMKEPIKNSYGKVLTFGLGLGYFAYMASLKDEVEHITIIEKDDRVIELFKQEILPFFNNKDKITIINDDAYEYIKKIDVDNYDYLFIDIWRDVSLGHIHYLKFKEILKNKKIKTDYWIEKSIKVYLKNEQYLKN